MPLPINKSQAIKSARWMKDHFGAQMAQAVAGTPVTPDLLCAVACQETAAVWVSFIERHAPAEIIARCVFDASGDYPGTSRSAFPRNTAAFRARYGDALTEMLIAEANLSRALRGLGAKQWVYKGYGIFQYDLQHIVTDRDFFEQKQWQSFETCCRHAVGELAAKFARHGDWWKAIKAYNGTGPRAEAYANNVTIFWDYCKSA